MDSFLARKHVRGKPLTSGEKGIVLYAFHQYLQENPTLPIKQVAEITSRYTGVSVSSILRARKEKQNTGKLTTPGKKRKREKPVLGQCDDFVVSAIRNKVHDFYRRNEPPTIDMVLRCVNDDPDLPNFKRSSFHKVMKQCGFEFTKNGWSLI